MSEKREQKEVMVRLGYPRAHDIEDVYDITDGVRWMADRIEELKDQLTVTQKLFIAAEAKLAKVMEAYQRTVNGGRADFDVSDAMREADNYARWLIATLEEDSDEQ